uniref:C2H2-type domain-containing protein n=1 Tax=Pfiesteria piscicida TaxID=71001 RepID=A3E3N2_PFIPI|nr:unknown [Pfiesteria piscicida]
MPETMEITEAAKSGDGAVTNVGIRTTGAHQCPDCRQKFDSEKAKQLHWKFIHDPNRHQED